VQADEVRDAGVAELGRPAEQRQAGPAVGRAHGVAADDAATGRDLAGSGTGHGVPAERAEHHQRDGDRHGQPERTVEALPGEHHAGHQRHDGEHHDADAHDDEERAVEHGGEVVVRGGPAGGLEGDDGDLDHHRPADDRQTDRSRRPRSTRE
jgi:hypothetical protein